jgi:hypothetical protein
MNYYREFLIQWALETPVTRLAGCTPFTRHGTWVASLLYNPIFYTLVTP